MPKTEIFRSYVTQLVRFRRIPLTHYVSKRRELSSQPDPLKRGGPGWRPAPMMLAMHDNHLSLAALLANADEVGDCLEWRGPYAGRGRVTPIARRYVEGRSENLSVIRLVWEQTEGPIPQGRIVYRDCCNHRCIRCLKCGKRGDVQRHRAKMGPGRALAGGAGRADAHGTRAADDQEHAGAGAPGTPVGRAGTVRRGGIAAHRHPRGRRGGHQAR